MARNYSKPCKNCFFYSAVTHYCPQTDDVVTPWHNCIHWESRLAHKEKA